MNTLRERHPFIAAFCVFCAIAVFRILCVKNLAVDVPWSDQWDGEIDLIYFKLLDGTLSIKSFWAQANEHHIVLTKLLNVLVFKLSGDQFNQLNALYPQALLFSMIPAFLAYRLNKGSTAFFRTFLLILIFIPIFDWENAYWSYQSQVYFSMLFGVIGAYFASQPDRSYVQIIFVTLLAGLSNGAAFYIPLLAACAVLLTWKKGRRSAYEFCFYMVVAFLTYKIFSAATPWHDQYKATSVASLFAALLRYAAWPQNAGWLLSVWVFVSAACVAKKIYKDDSSVSSLERYGLFLSLWFFLFLASSVYARAGFPNVPVRYYPYYLLGFSSLLFFGDAYKVRSLMIILGLLAFFYVGELLKDFDEWKRYSAMKASYRTNFIETLRMVKQDPTIDKAQIIRSLQRVPLPYAGYPNYEVPARVIQDPKAIRIFNYLIETRPD